MRKFVSIITTAVLALAVLTPAGAQTSTKTSVKSTVPKAANVMTSSKTPNGINRVTGTVTKDGIANGIVNIGVPKKGQIALDANSAKIRTKSGKFFSLSGIKPGSNITAMGKLSGKNFKATEIKVNYVPSSKKDVKTTTKTAKSVKTGSVSK